MPITYHIKEEEPLTCGLPYVEDFPKNIKLPDYIFKSLRVFGNTVISNKLVKKLVQLSGFCARSLIHPSSSVDSHPGKGYQT